MSDSAVVKRQLPCHLTEMEMADAAMLAATRQSEYDKVEEEKKRVMGRYTYRLKELRGQMSTESKKATTGIEERSVECVWCVDRERAKAILRRTDNQEIVQERDLTKFEVQLSMTELAQFLEENAESPSTAPDPEEGEDGVTVELFPESDEPLFEEAARFIVNEGVAKTAILQKHFNIGFTRANAILHQMEEEGIVGPADGATPRAILKTSADLDVWFAPEDGAPDMVEELLGPAEEPKPITAENCPINPRRAEILARDGV